MSKWRSNTVEVVEPVVAIKLVSQEAEKKHDLVGWPADEKSTAYDQRRLDSVAAGFVYRGTVWRKHLKSIRQEAQLHRVSARQLCI